MSSMLFHCCDDRRRRNEIAARDDVNAIEFLEVLDSPSMPIEERQRTLLVHFVNDPTALGIARENVHVDGGERIRSLRVVAAELRVVDGFEDPVLAVVVDRPGDFSTYTLRLAPTAGSALPGLDPLLRAVDFSFKVNCETTFDPLQVTPCAAEPPDEPALDYLARDYASLRRLMLDRLALLAPSWQERNPADAGMALVELLAYVGDQLSYRQDAVATEAYLGTCRLRTSARRHARLVDYAMHDGCNARTWVQLRVAPGTPVLTLREATFYSIVPGVPEVFRRGSREQADAVAANATAFELMSPVTLAPEHDAIRFYTWGARECCLPKGAVRASLRGELPNLVPGMVLVFKEVRSPRTGDPDDADLSHRHAVRITEVTRTLDPVGGRFDLPPTDDPVPVTEIAWAAADALPFGVCVSAETDDEFAAAYVEDVSIALGNIALADHGAEIDDEPLGAVPEDSVRQVLPAPPDDAEDRCRPDMTVLAPARFAPRLHAGPLTQAVPWTPDAPGASAQAALSFDARDALPAISLHDGTSEPWEPRPDLLASRTIDKHFVVEVEADGRGRVRFGDGQHGARPAATIPFTARYRVGNGTAGNIGADVLVHVACDEDGIVGARNPLPARGGVELETIDEVRHRAPVAFRPQTVPGRPLAPIGSTIRRAVTPADYAALTETHASVQRAHTSIRWTGSWRTVSVAVDRLGGEPVTADYEAELRAFLEPFRLAGHDLEIEPPRPVALEIAMTVRVAPGYHASHVRGVLMDAFSNRLLPGGRRGLFHPDNLTFGQTVYLSPLYEAAQAIDGVQSIDITTFQRRDRPGPIALDEGRLALGRLEIARLDNDPSFPERGALTLRMVGTG